MSRSRLAVVAVAVFLAGLTAAGCGTDSQDDAAASSAASCARLTDTPPWYGDNVSKLNGMLAKYGTCEGGQRNDPAPLALFDWDNTVVKNDIGNATFYWMVAHDKVRQPSAGDWSTTSPYLTPGAASALAGACGTGTAPGAPLASSSNAKCADQLLSVYNDAETVDGKAAFAGYDHRTMEPAYAWLGQLFAGSTPAEIAEYATKAREHALAQDIGATEKIGTTEVDSSVRYYDQIRNLINALRGNGFDVRVISASPESIVRVWAGELGFGDDKVMGIRVDTADGKYTSTIPGCGGRANNTVITYVDGKRCRVNEEVLGITGPAAFNEAPAQRRQVFAAGDSDTDVTFLSDATGLRLVINRNKPAVMCRAYADIDDKWIVNPMFIEPEKAQEKSYPCATAGDVDAAGAEIPVVVDGKTVPDQQDAVHG